MTDPPPGTVHIGHTALPGADPTGVEPARAGHTPTPVQPRPQAAGSSGQPAGPRRVPVRPGGEPGRARAAAGVRDAAIEAALDAMVDAAPPLDESVRRRLSQLLRQPPGTPTRGRRQGHRGDHRPGVIARPPDRAERPYAADADEEAEAS